MQFSQVSRNLQYLIISVSPPTQSSMPHIISRSPLQSVALAKMYMVHSCFLLILRRLRCYNYSKPLPLKL